MGLRLIFFVLMFLSLGASHAQKVLVSKEFNIRNDQAYEILGDIGERTLIYRDRGATKEIIALDSSMNFLWEKNLSFEDQRAQVYGLVPKDTSFITFHSYREDKEVVLNAGIFADNGNRSDTIEIMRQERSLFNGECLFELSELKSKSLLYFIEGNNKVQFYVFDNDNEELYWSDSFVIDDVNLRRDLVQVTVSEIGEIFLIFEKFGNAFRREDPTIEILGIFNKGEITHFQTYKIEDKKIKDAFFKLDNQQRRLGIFTLYGKKKANNSAGFGFTSMSISQFLKGSEKLEWKNFNKDLIRDISGDDGYRGIKNLEIVDIVWRRDGGFLLIAEEQREFSRRNNYATSTNYNNNFYSGGGWVDYFNEDIAVVAYDPKSEEHWSDVLYKKQFSQDDRGIFSSFFIFKTPSRLRLLYNDEIKNSSIVSEYILGPQGRSKRSSVLNTEYQNLRLRFKDALQVSSNELFVPSERNGSLSVVKIKY